MPVVMKGLTVFVADIRNCSDKVAEQKRVEKELAKIRSKFTNSKNLSGYDKKKYVWKLLYAYMLGYEIDFGQIQAVNLCSCTKYSEKSAGYLACSLLLHENHEILRLIVNIIRQDISNAMNEHVVALALNTVGNIGGSEFAENLFGDITRLISPGISPYVKRKALICLLRLHRKDNDTIECNAEDTAWVGRFQDILKDRDVGVLLSGLGLLLGILENCEDMSIWIPILDDVIRILKTIIFYDVGGGSPTSRAEHDSRGPLVKPEHIYYTVRAPWLQVKLLRVLQFFPVSILRTAVCVEHVRNVNLYLNKILSGDEAAISLIQMQDARKGNSWVNSAAGAGNNAARKAVRKADAERLNMTNAHNSVLFEGLNLGIHLEDLCTDENKDTACRLLGNFISAKEANIRYLGLETMSRLALGLADERLDNYRNLILAQMHETDVSIRRQALNLLYSICTKQNWQQIVDELLDILSQNDVLLQEELVLRIAILAEKNAPDFTWYIDVVFKMLEYAPESVDEDVWHRVVQVVTGSDDQNMEDLQRYAAEKAYQALEDYCHPTMVKLGAYLLGEFGHECRDISTGKQFSILKKHYDRAECKACRGGLILAFAKLLNANPDGPFTTQILAVFEELVDSPDIELQQRACEFLALHKYPAFAEAAFTMMPVYSTGKDNPLIRRLKVQNKSRATNRVLLEAAAKSEGGIYKKAVDSGKLSPTTRSNPATPEPSSAIVLSTNQPSSVLESLVRPPSGGPTSPSGGGHGGTGASGAQGGGPMSTALAIVPGDGKASNQIARLPGPGQGGDSGDSDDSDSSGSDSSDSDGYPSPKVLWQQLCLSLQGSFYLSESLCLSLKHEYKAEQGRVAIYFINKSADSSIVNLNIEIIHPPKSGNDNSDVIAVQRIDTQVKRTLNAGESFTHYLTLQCLRPFLQPLKYVVTFVYEDENVTLPLTLPSILTKFCFPAYQTNTVQEFERLFATLATTETVMQGTAKIPGGGQVHNVLKGCNFNVMEPYPQQQYFGVSSLSTKTQSNILLMVKLEIVKNKGKIVARAQLPQVAQTVANMLASYIIEAGK